MYTTNIVKEKQENPQNIWNNNSCNLKKNRVYKFSFSVQFYPENYQFGNIPIYVTFALTNTDKNLLRDNNYFKKLDSSVYDNNYLIYNKNISKLINLNIKQKYKYVTHGFTPCSSPCEGGVQQMKFKCKNIKNNTLDTNNSNCFGLIFSSQEKNCNQDKCSPQPEIQNLICYISISQKNNKNTYKNTECDRLGIRDFQNFEIKKKLQINPYYQYTRTFTSSKKNLDVEWRIITKKKYTKNHIKEAMIYSHKYNSYLIYTKEMGVSIISKKYLNNDCLWEIKAEPYNTSIYSIKHIKTQKYLYSTDKMRNYVEQDKLNQITQIDTGDVKNIDYKRFGEISCDKIKKHNWFIVPIEPLEIINKNYDYVNNVCLKNNLRLANKKEFSEFSQIGGINNDNGYWTSNIYPDYYNSQIYNDNCMTKCKLDCTVSCAPLLLYWPSYIGCVIGCQEDSCPKNCYYSSNENVSKDKKWYKSDITNNKLNMQKQSWIRGFNQGYSGIGNHSAGKYSGICIQNPVQYI